MDKDNIKNKNIVISNINNDNKEKLEIKKHNNIFTKIYLHEITENINFKKEDIKYNTPIIIEYNNIFFKISNSKVFDRNEATWNCVNKRLTKNKPLDKKNFCDGAIKGVRDIFSEKLYHYYLKNGHSKECLNLEYNISKSINLSHNTINK